MVREAKPDDPTTIVLRRTYEAPVEQVFAAWISPELVKQWLSPNDEIKLTVAEIDLREGGTYRFGYELPDAQTLTVVSGKYREVVPNTKLVFTWVWQSHPQFEGEETLVTVEFVAIENQTQVTLTHERFPSEAMRADHAWGWSGATDKLVRYCRFVCKSIPDGQRPF